MKTTLKIILAVSLSVDAPLLFAGEEFSLPITGNLTLISDYVFRGISQTQEKPALQAGLNYTHPAGLHANLWGSNINLKPKDNPNAYNDNASLELDIGAGYGGKINDSLTWDISATYFSYPGSSEPKPQYGCWELFPTLIYDFGAAKITGQLTYSPDFVGAAKRGIYFMAALDMPLPENFALNAHLGEQWLQPENDFGAANLDVARANSLVYIPKNYSEWKLGISKQIAGIGLELAYFDTSLNKEKCQAFAGQKDLCDTRVVFSLSKSF